MKIYIFIVFMGIIVLLFAMVASLARICKDKIKDKLRETKKKLMWNDMIQSIDIAYIEILMTAGIQMNMLMQGSE